MVRSEDRTAQKREDNSEDRTEQKREDNSEDRTEQERKDNSALYCLFLTHSYYCGSIISSQIVIIVEVSPLHK
jgi:hypothetical protein